MYCNKQLIVSIEDSLGCVFSLGSISFTLVFFGLIGGSDCALEEGVKHSAEFSSLLFDFIMFLLDGLHVFVQTVHFAELVIGLHLFNHLRSQSCHKTSLLAKDTS